MRFYYVNGDFRPTLSEAKAAARFYAKDCYDDVEVHLVDVATNRETMLRILNDTGGYMQTLREAVYVAKAKRKGQADD